MEDGGTEIRLKPNNELAGLMYGDYFIRVFSGIEAPLLNLDLNEIVDSILDTISTTYGLEIRVLQKESQKFQEHDAMHVEWLALGKYQQMADNIYEARQSYQYVAEFFYHKTDFYMIGRSNPLPVLNDPANPKTKTPQGIDDRTRRDLKRFLNEFSFDR